MSTLTSVPPSFHGLRSHRIFLPEAGPSSSKSKQDEDWELVDSPADSEDVLGGQKVSKVVLRDKDLIVAHGTQIRVTSVGVEAWLLADGHVGSYKVVKSAHLNFPIHQLALNPTGLLLAVIGHHQVAVIVLPKTGQVGTSGGTLECKSFLIDPFQFSSKSKSVISKVSWHPWGENGNSIWILTADGKLREYDVLQPEDPAQTFSFLPQTSTSTRFSAIDPLSLYATSFAFSLGATDFGPLSVYVTMANGDLYLMSPVLPLHAEVPLLYLQGLKHYVDQVGDEGERRWVESLVKQVRIAESAVRLEEDEGNVRFSPGGGAAANNASKGAGPTTSREGKVRLHPPHLTESGGPAVGAHRTLARQGPITFRPGPPDDEAEDDETVLCDLTIMSVVARAEADDEDGANPVNIIVMIWSSGRVDIGLEVEKPRTRWISSKESATSAIILPIMESIYLAVNVDDDMSERQIAPSFVQDALQRDMIYVRHNRGLDSISFAPWLSKSNEKGRLPSSEVLRVIDCDGSHSQSLTGMITFCNLSLGYGLLALAQGGSMAAIELDLRAIDSSTDAATPSTTHDTDNPATTSPAFDVNSLLIASHFDLDQHITNARKIDVDPQDTLRKSPNHGKPLERVSPDLLRAFGQITSDLHARTQAIRTASQAVEGRLDLQIQEFQRQFRSLKSVKTSFEVLTMKNPGVADRAEDLVEKQRELAGRLDSVIVAMTAERKPEIGDVERGWFDELDRLKEEVGGGSQGGRKTSLSHRTLSLKEQVEVIKPSLKKQNKQEDQSKEGSEAYDNDRLESLGTNTSSKGEEIKRLTRKVEALMIRMDGIAGSGRL